jgi:uncharacterized protein YcgL (UPF0745 family)
MKAWKYMSNSRVLLLARKDEFSCLPDDLRKVFEQTAGVQVDVPIGKPLVGADSSSVILALEAQGWHLWP